MKNKLRKSSGSEKSELRKLVGEKTGKVFTFLSDYLLFQLLFWIELPTAGYGVRNVYKASERAAEEFFKIKGRQARVAVSNLRSGGYIKFARGGSDPADDTITNPTPLVFKGV